MREVWSTQRDSEGCMSISELDHRLLKCCLPYSTKLSHLLYSSRPVIRERHLARAR